MKGVKVGGYWVTTRDIATILGCAQSRIYRLMEDRSDWPAPETHLGRSQVWDRARMIAYLRQVGENVKTTQGIGLKKPVVPKDDELLSIEEVMEILGYKARAEFQMRVNQGQFQKPDFYFQRPFPSFWLKSTIYTFIRADKPFLAYRRLGGGRYRVLYGKVEQGIVWKQVKGTHYVRKRKTGLLQEEEVVEWKIEGGDGIYGSRKEAAWALVKSKELEALEWVDPQV